MSLEVLTLSSKILKPQGVFVSKLFMGEDFIEIKNLAKSLFPEYKFLNQILVEVITRNLFTL